MAKKLHQGTVCVQSGYASGNGQPRQMPIIQSTTFKYDTSEDMTRLFDLEDNGYFYTRLQNPTNDMVAARITALEGGVAGMLTSSGQAANFFACFNICEAGDHMISVAGIYGGTFNLFGTTFKKMGIDVTFIDQDASVEEIEAAFRPNTKLVFGETYDLLRAAEVAAVTSGTATLETAYLRCPQVVCYQFGGGRLVYRIMKFVLRHIRYVSLVNLLLDGFSREHPLQQPAVTELLGYQLTPEAIRHELIRLLGDGAERQQMLAEYDRMIGILGEPGAPEHAAQVIVRLLK